MNISVCVTTFNRTDLLYQSVIDVLDDPRVSEIVISDDCSEEHIFNEIVKHYEAHEKVKIFRNQQNLDCYLNKCAAIHRASFEWCILLDSDNILTKGYIDRIESLIVAGVNPKTVYQPDFAKPHFDFQFFAGAIINKGNIASLMGNETFQTMLNAMNYFVNRAEYLRIFDRSVNPVTSDSIFHNYNWLKAGNSIYVVPSLQYEHRIHEGSHYRNNVRRTPAGFHDGIVNKLKALQ